MWFNLSFVVCSLHNFEIWFSIGLWNRTVPYRTISRIPKMSDFWDEMLLSSVHYIKLYNKFKLCWTINIQILPCFVTQMSQLNIDSDWFWTFPLHFLNSVPNTFREVYWNSVPNCTKLWKLNPQTSNCWCYCDELIYLSLVVTSWFTVLQCGKKPRFGSKVAKCKGMLVSWDAACEILEF